MFSVPAEECSWVLLPLLFPVNSTWSPWSLSISLQKRQRGWAGQGCWGARQAPDSALQKGFLLLRSQEENKIQYLSGWTLGFQCCIAVVIHHESIILRSNKGHFKEVKSITKYIENLRHFKDLWKHFTWGLLGSFSLAWLWGPGEVQLNCLGQTEQILSSP